MKTDKLISLCENEYKMQVDKISDYVIMHPEIRLILVAGPSCSGKTTTSSLLSEQLYKKAGITSYTISIDDFYKDVNLQPGEDIKERDFEAIESIDLDLLHLCLHDLSVGKTVDIPLFDFEKTYRNGIRNTITLKDKDIAIIEGLHALNPIIYENFVEKEKICKVFLDCVDVTLSKFDEKKPRLLRRLVRDSNFRNADAYLTFLLWVNVLKGERKYIYPFKNQADFCINTFHTYETALLKPFAKKLLKKVKKDSEYYADALDALNFLKKIKGRVKAKQVPEDSLLREFVG